MDKWTIFKGTGTGRWIVAPPRHANADTSHYRKFDVALAVTVAVADYERRLLAHGWELGHEEGFEDGLQARDNAYGADPDPVSQCPWKTSK